MSDFMLAVHLHSVSFQGSTIVGFDVQAVQPKLNLLEKSLARRLRWVQGNL